MFLLVNVARRRYRLECPAEVGREQFGRWSCHAELQPVSQSIFQALLEYFSQCSYYWLRGIFEI